MPGWLRLQIRRSWKSGQLAVPSHQVGCRRLTRGLDDLGDRLGPPGAVVGGERVGGLGGLVAVLGAALRAVGGLLVGQGMGMLRHRAAVQRAD
jgi:hypothetical protein